MSFLLFLNDIAGSEILLILAFVLLFFGANSIPSIAKTMGKAIYQIRNASDDIKDEIKKSGVDIKKDLNISELVKETEEEIKQPMDQMLTDIKHTVNYEPPAKKKVKVESGSNKNLENEGD
ncbi:MAG: twin-arginine translocase TatA/TatE family subunit [Crocinitomicaceae bacterium]|jgi:sec-independent protein translocase protein TatA|nr:twin-arginine translocase TatA/TatE family subunit [Crocinitomicaceae bacterium]